MKVAKFWLKVFNILIWVWLIVWASTLIIPNSWVTLAVLIHKLVGDLVLVTLGISVISAYLAWVNRKRVYYYEVKCNYTVAGNNVLNMQYTIERKSPLTKVREFKHDMELHRDLHPKYKKSLQNGDITVREINYLGSEYKY